MMMYSGRNIPPSLHDRHKNIHMGGKRRQKSVLERNGGGGGGGRPVTCRLGRVPALLVFYGYLIHQVQRRVKFNG
jgi:hypothetical protein